jgi:two-component system chemotaxis response regulator CheB
MCSSLTQRGARVTLDALAAGASDYVTKPAGQSDRETAQNVLACELIPRIHALARSAISPKHMNRQFHAPLLPVAPLSPHELSTVPALLQQPPEPATPSVLAIGVSTGGPAALDVLLPSLPGDFPIPVLVVQHMPELFTCLLAERLNGRCQLPVREAAEGDPVRPGTIYIARGNWHLEIKAAAASEARAGSSVALRLSQGALENHCRPAVDVLFRSIAGVYGSGAVALVMTGMGCDGLKGCRAIREHGGYVLVQDQATSTVWGMPGAVSGAGLAQKILPLDALAPEILRIVGKPALQPSVHALEPGHAPGRQAVL